MGRRSSVDALPEELRDWIMRLREQGHTYDQLVAKLRELDSLAVAPSRSALHRYIQEAERARELTRRQLVIAQAVGKDLDDSDDSQLVRGNVTMLHSILMRVQMAALVAAEEGDGKIELSTAELAQLAKAMDHLGKARKDDLAVVIASEKRGFAKATLAAATVASQIAQEAGLNAERVAEIRRGVLGLRLSPPSSEVTDGDGA